MNRTFSSKTKSPNPVVLTIITSAGYTAYGIFCEADNDGSNGRRRTDFENPPLKPTRRYWTPPGYGDDD